MHLSKPSEAFMAHCMRRADWLRDAGLTQITAPTVGLLLYKSATKNSAKCQRGGHGLHAP
jgi:hypothetical protein